MVPYLRINCATIAHMHTDERIAELYSNFLEEGYAELASDPASYPLFPVMERVLRDYSSETRGESALDLACGPGLLKECADYSSYAGMDLSEPMLQAAADRGYGELIQSSLLDYLPYIEDASYDSVICFSALYFLDPESAKQVVAHMGRIARKFCLVTLDAIPKGLVAMYEKSGIPLFDHSGMEIPGETERFEVEGWVSASGEGAIRMPVSIVRK